MPGDAAGLLKLLLAAHDIAMPDRQPATEASESDAGIAHGHDSDAGITPVARARTATEMLTGAIEILKSLEAGPVTKGLDIPGAADDVMPRVPMPMVMPAPSAEFIGPMPMVKRPSAGTDGKAGTFGRVHRPDADGDVVNDRLHDAGI